MKEYKWPYANEIGDVQTDEAEVLVLGGGLAGCFAAIAAAEKGKSVILVEKGATDQKRKRRHRFRPLGICLYQSLLPGYAGRDRRSLCG